MGGINFGRVILGGLVAGLLMNVGEFLLNGVILHSAMVDWGTKHNLPPEPSPSFYVAAIGLTFVLGIITVWVYALIRSRLGAGPKTAIVAAPGDVVRNLFLFRSDQRNHTQDPHKRIGDRNRLGGSRVCHRRHRRRVVVQGSVTH